MPGNSESVEELRDSASNWKSARVLHGDGCQIDGVDFWGLGGAIPVTPFGSWSYDFDEPSAREMLSGCPDGAILVVHSPPIDTVDCNGAGRRLGSTEIRRAIERVHPQLVVCGHIHADWGKEASIGPTRIINAGPAGILIEVDG